jgi:hypothetical protein
VTWRRKISSVKPPLFKPSQQPSRQQTAPREVGRHTGHGHNRQANTAMWGDLPPPPNPSSAAPSWCQSVFAARRRHATHNHGTRPIGPPRPIWLEADPYPMAATMGQHQPTDGAPPSSSSLWDHRSKAASPRRHQHSISSPPLLGEGGCPRRKALPPSSIHGLCSAVTPDGGEGRTRGPVAGERLPPCHLDWGRRKGCM